MKYPALTLSTALLCLTTPVIATEDPEGSLARARGLFTKVDTNGDGLVSALEAGRNRIPSKDFVAYDADRDRKLSSSEFTLFYRQLLVKNGKEVDDDLAGEAARIEAGRRARKAEKTRDTQRAETARQADLVEAQRAAKARKDKAGADVERARKGPKDQSGLPGGEGSKGTGEVQGLTDEQRIELARREKEALDAARAEELRKEKLAQDAARAEEARKEKLAQDAARAEKARQEKLAQDAARTEKARQEKLAQDAARTEKARKARLQEEADRADQARRGTPERQPAETRAAGYVKRLVDSGRLSAENARDFRTILDAPAVGAPGALNPAVLRKALSAAKKRISSLVVSGALSSEEGRQLFAALDGRAKAALPSGGEPKGRKRQTQSRPTGTEDARAKGNAAGTRRVGEVKRTGVIRPSDKNQKRRDG